MTVEFVESFDHLATADLTYKWNGLNSAIAITANGRNGNGLSAPGTNDYLTKSGLAAVATRIVAFAFRAQGLPESVYYFFNLLDSGTSQCSLGLNADGTIAFARGTSVTLATSTNAIQTGTWYYLEAKITINSTTGACEMRINGTSTGWIDASNVNCQASGNASSNSFRIGTLNSPGSTGELRFDDLYVIDTTSAPNNDFLGDCTVQALFPSGAGTTTQWTASAGSNYQCVDEADCDEDTTYVSSATANQIDTYAYDNLPVGIGTVKAVQVNMVARKDDSGARGISPVVRPSATDRVGTEQNPGVSYANLFQVYNVSPETSSAWTDDEVDGTEFGVKLTT